MLNAQQTQGIENFDSFNTFDSKQKLQQALEAWSNFSFLFLTKGEKYIELWQIWWLKKVQFSESMKYGLFAQPRQSKVSWYLFAYLLQQ